MDDSIKGASTAYSIKDVAERDDHAELIKGVLVVSDKTSVAHNNAVLEIASALRRFIGANNGKCKDFSRKCRALL